MSWSSEATLRDRLGAVQVQLRQLLPGARRVGATYQGFIKALKRYSGPLLRAIEEELRQQLTQVAGPAWFIEGWLAFTVDGTKIDLPRTTENERCFATAGKPGSAPQSLLTVLLHLATGVPWGYRLGPADASERHHLRWLQHLLPAGSLLVADAGFVGYELLRLLNDSGRCFLIRVGANAHLLTHLGAVRREGQSTVYLWPKDQQDRGQPPLVLRLIRLEHNDQSMYLLTNVLDRQRLSHTQARRFYQWRWGVEVFYRTFKQTLFHRKMLSRAPVPAALELRWCFIGLWLLRLMTVRARLAAGRPPLRSSIAQALGHVRAMLRQPDRRFRRGQSLQQLLAQAEQDEYRRHGPKRTRPWPSKKKQRPPGQPRITEATPAQVQLAKELRYAQAA